MIESVAFLKSENIYQYKAMLSGLKSLLLFASIELARKKSVQ